MKLYIKKTNGQTNIMPANKIVIVKDNAQIFNPTEDMLLEDGWKEYHTTFVEPTEEELLRDAKEILKNDILLYDSSEEVNIFYVNGFSVWLDKATRSGLMLRFQAESALGKTNTALWYDGIEFPLQVNEGIQMLYLIEAYASQCYDNTQKHLSNISKLETLEEVKNYDYKIGYPQPLQF